MKTSSYIQEAESSNLWICFIKRPGLCARFGVDNLLTIRDRHWRKLAAILKKQDQRKVVYCKRRQ